jgi:hypothetical protein
MTHKVTVRFRPALPVPLNTHLPAGRSPPLHEKTFYFTRRGYPVASSYASAGSMFSIRAAGLTENTRPSGTVSHASSVSGSVAKTRDRYSDPFCVWVE